MHDQGMRTSNKTVDRELIDESGKAGGRLRMCVESYNGGDGAEMAPFSACSMRSSLIASTETATPTFDCC